MPRSPRKVARIEDRDNTRMAEVDFGGAREHVCLQYIPDVSIDDVIAAQLRNPEHSRGGAGGGTAVVQLSCAEPDQRIPRGPLRGAGV